MRRILRWVVGVPIAFLVIGFAVANRRFVTLSLDPFSQAAPSIYIDLPLWILFFLGIFVGLIIGWVAAWWAQGKHRKAAREARSEISRLQTELSQAQNAAIPEQPSRDIATLPGGFL